jgi:hypothetical protein
VVAPPMPVEVGKLAPEELGLVVVLVLVVVLPAPPSPEVVEFVVFGPEVGTLDVDVIDAPDPMSTPPKPCAHARGATTSALTPNARRREGGKER